ncbi:hypothetical protein FRB99_009010 [Tulasnella sp. 403]|nr:hypothetical protein FRB99_009010 [Tulasnella sp. 403]
MSFELMSTNLQQENYFSSDAQHVIAPHNYLLERKGLYSARIFEAGETEENGSLVTVHEHSFNPFRRQNAGYERLDGTSVPVYYFDYSDGHYVMYRGPGPDDPSHPSQPVLNVTTEGFMHQVSTYTEVTGSQRKTKMYKPKGPDGYAWWSWKRILIDFDGTQYVWHTTAVWQNMSCTRQDGKEMISFHRDKFKVYEMGYLKVHEPIPADLLHLLLASFMVKYKVEADRRWFGATPRFQSAEVINQECRIGVDPVPTPGAEEQP